MTYAEYASGLRALAANAPTLEWQVVMLYYAAVHATNSVLYDEGAAPRSHERHERRISEHASLQQFFADYKELQRLSIDARYRPLTHPFATAKCALAERLCAAVITACGL